MNFLKQNGHKKKILYYMLERSFSSVAEVLAANSEFNSGGSFHHCTATLHTWNQAELYELLSCKLTGKY